MTTRITNRQYEKLVNEGKTTHAYDNKSNHADTIIVDGVVYSEEKFAQVKRYSWQRCINGQKWYYMNDNGDVLVVHVRRK